MYTAAARGGTVREDSVIGFSTFLVLSIIYLLGRACNCTIKSLAVYIYTLCFTLVFIYVLICVQQWDACIVLQDTRSSLRLRLLTHSGQRMVIHKENFTQTGFPRHKRKQLLREDGEPRSRNVRFESDLMLLP